MELYIEGDVLRIGEEIYRRYEGRVKLQFLNPRHEDVKKGDPLWRIVECRPDGQEDVVFSTHELDDRVLHRLAQIDAAKNEAFIDRVARKELALKQAKDKARAELKAENREFLTTVLKQDKTFTFRNHEDDLVKWTPDKPIERKSNGYIS